MAKVSTKGYKKNSKDKNEPFLRIPSSTITMKEDDGTPLRKGPILGIDNFGNQQLMLPGMDYQFPGNSVYEIPMAKMGGAKKVKIHSLPKAQNGLATAADSSLVANRANDVFNYYKNNPAYDVTRPVYPPGVTPPPPPSPSDLAKLLKRSREAYNEAVSESNGRTLLHVDRSGKTKVANNPKLEDYYQDLGNNKFLQRELSFGAINIDSPMPIYDTRINPQKLSAFDMRPNFVTNQQVRAGAGYPFNTMPIRDHVEVATYDVLATTPWAELSTEEQLKRLKKFGTSGSPYKNKAAAIKKLKAQLNAPKVEPPIIDKPVQIPNQPEDFKIPFKADPNRKQFLIKSTGDAALDKLNQELYGNFGSLTNNGYIPEYSPYIKDVETRTPEKEMRRIKTPKFNYGGDLPKAQPGLEVPLDADRYGVNKFIPKGDDTQYVDPALFQQVQDLQNRINPLAQSSKAARQEYEKKVLDAINKVESQNYDVTTSGYIPESVRQSEDVKQNGLNGCISGVCYTLNEAGEPVKYYSNSMFQDAIKAGTEKDWALDFDTKNISGGDIIQFTGDREGPHHAALVVPNSIVNNEDGTITFEAFMNSGDGPMYKKTYTLDPKEDRVDNFRNETVQLLKRKNTSDLDNLVNQRDQLKAQIEAADPAAFKKGRARRWNTYMPGAFRELGVDYTRFDGQDPERMVAGSMMQNLNLEDAARLLRQTTISTPKPIDGIKIKFDSKYDVDYDALRKTAGFENILNQVNDPEFKMNFMKDMNITNREYNAIVSNTFGIYGQETGFGTKANSIKETDVARKTDSVLGDVWSRVTGHGAFKRDIDEDYSRGLTQVKLKNIKGQDRRQYGINKESIESDPTKAFTAAMIANAQNLPELRKLASKGETDALGMNNYLDFIPYMYNQPNRIRRGDRKTIEEALAEGQDPAQALVIDPNSPMANNEYIKNVRTYANLFKFMPLAADAPDEKASQIPTKAYGGDISVPDLRRVKIDSLPKAQTGIPADYQKFLQYSETAPDNRRPDAEWQYGNPRQYDHYGMWDALGKPENFDQALEMNPHWQPDPYDGMYHGFSTNPSTGVWLKSHIPGESHPGDTGWMEYKDFMLSNDRNWGGKNQNLVYDPELQRMRYIERNKKGGSLPKAQKGKEWLDLGYENKVYTYKDNPDFFDSHARLSDNPRYNDWIKQTVYSGKWGYNPVTGESVRLDANQQATVDPITQNLAKDKRTFNEIRKTDKAFDEHLKQAEKESGKAVGRAQSKAMVSNPAFYAPGVIGAAAVAPEVLPPLFESIGGALATPLMHPITGATIMPGLTGGAVIDAAFAAHGLKTIVSGEAIEPWRHAAQTGNVSDYLSAAGQNFITALETLPVTGPLVKGGLELSKPALDATGKFLTTQTPLKNTYKINPWAGKLGEYNRVVGSDAIADLQASGLVRSGKGAVTTEGGIPVSRPTAWPSFAKGSPRETYMRGVTERGDTPYIISTDRPMAVSTLGRHGKGSTQFPVGPDGNYLTSFPASEATVYKGSPNWLKGYLQIDVPKPFKSEIDWAKWNPETAQRPDLLEEYKAIEKASKENGTWMKNPDGSDFIPSPLAQESGLGEHQFIMEQSKRFKEAYPEGFDMTYRGSVITEANADLSLPTTYHKVTGDKAIFTSNRDLAHNYTYLPGSAVAPPMLPTTITKGPDAPGGVMYELIHPSGNSMAYNTTGDHWANINLVKNSSLNQLTSKYEFNKKWIESLKKLGATPESIAAAEAQNIELSGLIKDFSNPKFNWEEFAKMRQELGDFSSTDAVAKYLEKTKLNKIKLENLRDPALGDVTVVNNRPGNFMKSRIGNVGDYNLNNSDIFKAILPPAILFGAGAMTQQKQGGAVKRVKINALPNNWKTK